MTMEGLTIKILAEKSALSIAERVPDPTSSSIVLHLNWLSAKQKYIIVKFYL